MSPSWIAGDTGYSESLGESARCLVKKGRGRRVPSTLLEGRREQVFHAAGPSRKIRCTGATLLARVPEVADIQRDLEKNL